ncbi:hypothetical protein AB0K16_24760 [Nonomuraea jabiensis]|uniref:hypothetical protein n=1 Tax=Nonomuraea jabiensis TaxID=882448 RepID=UPI0034266F30
MRWDGKAWHPVALPAVAVPAAALPAYGPVRVRYDAVLAAANGDVWIAAGFQQGDWTQPGAVLLHRRGGTCEQLRASSPCHVRARRWPRASPGDLLRET